jgi:hypothetical protein
MTREIVPARRGRALRRREVLGLLGGGAVALLLAACGGNNANRAGATAPASAALAPPLPASATDFSARFANFAVADEPEGDLSKVVWPAFVTNAGPEVQRLYEFQVTNGALMRYMPCFCGCQSVDGHRNNRDCYIDRVNPDGTVVFDSMAPT